MVRPTCTGLSTQPNMSGFRAKAKPWPTSLLSIFEETIPSLKCQKYYHSVNREERQWRSQLVEYFPLPFDLHFRPSSLSPSRRSSERVDDSGSDFTFENVRGRSWTSGTSQVSSRFYHSVNPDGVLRLRGESNPDAVPTLLRLWCERTCDSKVIVVRFGGIWPE